MSANFRPGARISGGDRDLTEAFAAIESLDRRHAGLLAYGEKGHPAEGDVWQFQTPSERARLWLNNNGVSTNGLSKAALLDLGLSVSRDIEEGRRSGGHGSTTFAGHLQNQANGNMMLGWDRNEHSWRKLARTGIVNSFSPTNLAGLDEISLNPVGERGEIQVSPMADRVEFVQPVAYAALLPISRAALLADERRALVLDPLKAGVAASARVNEAFYALLALASGAGPTLNTTSRALFNSTDGNLATSPAALSVTTLNAARKALRRQTDGSSGRRLNIAPRTLLVPPSIESTALILAASEALPGSQNNLNVVCDAALEDISTTAFYLLADHTINDTFEVAFVGEASPRLSERGAFETDGLVYKLTIDFVPVALGHKTVYRDAGA